MTPPRWSGAVILLVLASAVHSDRQVHKETLGPGLRQGGGADVDWSQNERVNDDTGSAEQWYPSLAVDEVGNAYAAWMDKRDFYGGNIYFARRPSGGVSGPNERVNLESDGGYGPSLGIDADGNSYVIWAGYRSLLFSYRPAGGSWVDSTQVNDVDDAAFPYSALAVDANGNAYAIWADCRNSNNNWCGDGTQDLYFDFRPAGGSWGTDVRVNDVPGVVVSGGGGPKHAAIAVDSGGNAHAVWRDRRDGDERVYFSFRPSNGSSWSANEPVSGPSYGGPDIAVDGEGNAYAVWIGFGVGSNWDIFFNRRPAGGAFEVEAFTRVNDDSGLASQASPAIAVDGSGNAYAVWEDNRHLIYFDASSIYSAYRPVNGEWEANVLVNDVVARIRHPDIAADGGGNGYAVWGDERQGNWDIFSAQSSSGVPPPVVTLPYLITGAIPTESTAQGETFLESEFLIDYAGETVLLSESADGTGQTQVDDGIQIIVTHPDTSTAEYRFDYSHGCGFGEVFPEPPHDISHLFIEGRNKVVVRLYDICGSVVWSSALYMGVPEPGAGALEVTVILARAKDGPLPKPEHTIAHFETLFDALKDFHLDNSYRVVALDLSEIVTAEDEGWIELSKTLSEYRNQSDPEQAFSDDAVNAVGVVPGSAEAEIVIVVFTGPPTQLSASSGVFNTSTDVFSSGSPWIMVSEDDLVGAWAHEVGHDLGLYMRDDASMAPHPYPLVRDPRFRLWDLMAAGSWGGDPQGSTPTFMSSATRRSLGLLTYEPKSREAAVGTYWLESVATTSLGDSVLRVDLDGSDCYVLEARTNSSQYSAWDTSIPSNGVAIYHIDSNGVSACGDLTMVAGPDSNGNSQEEMSIRRLLGTPGSGIEEGWCDWWWKARLCFSVVGVNSGSASYQIAVRIETLENRLAEKVRGIIASGSSALGGLIPYLPGVPQPSASDESAMPAIDLHAYGEGGFHVGMDYSTGLYEMGIGYAQVSGNQLSGPEFIVLPASDGDLHYIISSLPTAVFLEQHPDLREAMGSEDVIEVQAVSADPGGAPYGSATTELSIPHGGFLEIEIVVIENSDGSETVSIGEVAVTIDALIAELDSYNDAGSIKTEDAFQSLMGKLMAIKEKIAQGKTKSARNQLKAFQNQLRADSLVETYARDSMLRDSQALIDSLDN